MSWSKSKQFDTDMAEVPWSSSKMFDTDMD